MATAKRLYLYGVSAAGLLMSVAGSTLLFRTLVNNFHIGPQYATGKASSGFDHDALSLGLGLLVAGALVWLFHWAVVERMVKGPSDGAAAERRSIVRSVYFALVLGISIPVAASQWIELVARIIADRLEAPAAASTAIIASLEDDATLLSLALAATGVFAYHAWIRDRDLRQTDLIAGAAAWVSRFYLYGVVFVALVSALGEISAIAQTIARQAASITPAGGLDLGALTGEALTKSARPPEGAAWVRPVVTSLVGVLVWGGIWLGHWMYSLRLRRAQNPQGEAERVSKVRLAFFAVVVLWGASTVVSGVSEGTGNLIARLLDTKSSIPTWYLVFVPPVLAIPAAVAWWWHRQVSIGEEPTGPAGISATRILLYVTALVGLAALAGGALQAIRAVLIQMFSPAATKLPDLWKEPVSLGVAAFVIGGALWVVAWMFAERRLPPDRSEAVTASRSYYMYLALGGSVVVGATALAIFVYRYFNQIIGPNNPALAEAVAGSIAALVVAGAILGYHAWVYRRDANTPEGQELLLPTTGPGWTPAAPPARRTRSRAQAEPPAQAAVAAKPAAQKPAVKPPAKPAPAAKAPAAKAPAAKAPAAKPAGRRAAPKK
jgi:hypothetical protein